MEVWRVCRYGGLEEVGGGRKLWRRSKGLVEVRGSGDGRKR